jgi:hypothetical protein
MMGLIVTFVIILVFIFFIACTVGITLNNKKKNILNKQLVLFWSLIYKYDISFSCLLYFSLTHHVFILGLLYLI